MAYNPVDETWLEAGEPTRKEIFQRFKANQDFFDAQIEALAQTARVSCWNLTVGGSINQYTTAQINARLPRYAAPVAAKLVEVKMTLLVASGSGTLSLNVLKSTDGGVTFNTVLTSNVELTGTTVGSTSGAVVFISEPAQFFNQGDILAIELPTRQASQGRFQVEIYAELQQGGE